MAQDVEAGCGGDLWRHRSRVLGIEISERWFQAAAGDAGLRLEADHVEHADAGGLAARAGGGWNRHEWLEWTGDGESLADRCVHVVQEIGRWVSGVEVHRLRGIDRRSTA